MNRSILSANGKRKPIDDPSQDPPFQIPSTWAWARFGDVIDFVAGRTPSTKDSRFWEETQAGHAWVSIADLNHNGGVSTTEKRISGRAAEQVFRGEPKPAGTILMSFKLTVGKTSRLEVPAYHNEAIISVAPSGALLDEFLFAFLPLISAGGQTRNAIKGKTLNKSSISALWVPVPPLTEQRRIVKKVDELMALADALEAGTREGMEAHETLVRELLATLVNSQNANELAENWSRIETNFDTLFTTEESIDALKHTVVELAVTGRLVSPNPNDQSAENFLGRILKQRANDLQTGEFRKQKPLPKFERDHYSGTIPKHWAVQQLDSLVHVHSGITKGRNLRGKTTLEVPYLRVANVQRGYLDLSEIKEIVIAEEEMDKYGVEYGDLLVTEGGDWDKVGRTCIWRSELDYVAHQNHVFKARKILPQQNENWLELYLNSAVAREYFATASKQTTNLASINKTELRSCPVPIPPPQEAERILEKCYLLLRICDELAALMTKKARTECDLADCAVTSAKGVKYALA